MSMVKDRDAGRAGAGRNQTRRRAGAAIALLTIVTFGGACGGESGARDARRTALSSQRARGVDTAAPRIGQRAPAGPAARRTILFVGTSLTAGQGLEPDSAYPQMIDRKLDSLGLPYDAVNAGVSGETSSGLLRRIDWLLREPFDVIVVETGANDGLRGTPVATVRANVQQVIDRIRSARPTAAILLVQMEALPNFGEQYTSEFRALFPQLARRNGLVLLPFLLEGVAGHSDLNQPDGIHPNLTGERIVAENIWRALLPVLEQRLREQPLSSGG
jgi:acyl-CoA thioesterase-1